MRKALSFARHTWPSPNPRVGAILVKDGIVVGHGRHVQSGGEHAEVAALKKAGLFAKGATAYVTLEPCSHYGRTGPCAEALISAKISRVVIGCIDPNPKVAGQGVKKLRAAGVEILVGVEEIAAKRLVAGHNRFMTMGLPFLVWKYAMSVDGKIATVAGESRWITGEQARREVQRMRRNFDGIVTGIGTVLADDPELTVRGVSEAHQPKRIIFDSRGRLPISSRLLNTVGGEVIVVVSKQCKVETRNRLAAAGATMLEAGDAQVDVIQALHLLAVQFGIREVLLESGGELAASMVSAGLVQEAVCFVAGKLIGGRKAPGPLGGEGAKSLSNVPHLRITRTRRFGEDVALYGVLGEN